MPSIVGHALGAGAAMGFAGNLAMETSRWRRGAWLAAAIGIVPDLDAVLYLATGSPGWLEPGAGFSHSLLFAGLLGLGGAAYLLKGQRSADGGEWLGAILVVSLVAAVHPLADLLSPARGLSGVPLFWPFTARPVPFSPLQLLPTAARSAESLSALVRVTFLEWRSLVGMTLEAIILVPLAVLAWKRELSSAARWTLCAVSGAGVALTALLYNFLDVLR
ncbi:MAG: metal-dependent hydrolase [Planctomycetota bacterium]|jgi:membrane-bound metal-dependent hydrolase YbcI (DUF457 family)